ncbi:DUF58 domain-containing protein [Halocynthiibacter namhaensis]|uniref:DUF58 domain-containing protein n=1 Tax=Halocynthiibacter namhaensis TaxID=1290553 RepID=UPI001EE31455|nr:DUF58 domain-containing protein [Halocynthiibacter namhaensis]
MNHPPVTARALRRGGAEISASLPPLLAAAERLAQTVLPGLHGRRRAGQGDEFWQYRPATDSDELRHVDWRRSAKSDVNFIRQREWQLARTVMFWVDPGASMRYSSDKNTPEKSTRASILTLACAMLLQRGGERFGLIGATPSDDISAGSGDTQILRMTQALEALNTGEADDFASPDLRTLRPNTQLVILSDFLNDPKVFSQAIDQASAAGVTGLTLQILDPAEEAFPWQGRTIFESKSGALRHETLRAIDLRDRYLDRLNARKAQIRDHSTGAGWQHSCHHSDASAATALLWMYQALERRHL